MAFWFVVWIAAGFEWPKKAISSHLIFNETERIWIKHTFLTKDNAVDFTAPIKKEKKNVGYNVSHVLLRAAFFSGDCLSFMR